MRTNKTKIDADVTFCEVRLCASLVYTHWISHIILVFCFWSGSHIGGLTVSFGRLEAFSINIPASMTVILHVSPKENWAVQLDPKAWGKERDICQKRHLQHVSMSRSFWSIHRDGGLVILHLFDLSLLCVHRVALKLFEPGSTELKRSSLSPALTRNMLYVLLGVNPVTTRNHTQSFSSFER